METRTCAVAIKIDKDKVIVDTDEPIIPTPIVQKLVDELMKVTANSIPDALEDLLKEKRRWKILAILELIILLIVVLKIKGVF